MSKEKTDAVGFAVGATLFLGVIWVLCHHIVQDGINEGRTTLLAGCMQTSIRTTSSGTKQIQYVRPNLDECLARIPLPGHK